MVPNPAGGFHDRFREYPYRALGYSAAVVRPWKDQLPRPVHQAALGVMHTYFLTNSYDYATRVDSTSWTSSFLDCYTWHCCASWAGPAMVVDGVLALSSRMGYSRTIGRVATYAVLPIASICLDKVTNWYFYNLWSAGNKDKPRLRL